MPVEFLDPGPAAPRDPAGTPTCTLGTIPAGGNDSYTITVTVDRDITAGTTLTNTATVPVPGSTLF